MVIVLDAELGNIKTRFLDMPVVNIGTAEYLFSALKESLSKYNLDLSKAIAFMSDTTNVMKGARSGVQKLIKREKPIFMMLVAYVTLLTCVSRLEWLLCQLIYTNYSLTSIISLNTEATEINSLLICGILSIITNPKFS